MNGTGAATTKLLALEDAACAVCGHRESRQRLAVQDRWYNPPRITWCIVECQRCRLLYVNPRPQLGDLALFYPPGYHDPVTPSDDWWVQRLACDRAALVRRWHAQPGRILDVGFGAGELLLALQRHGWEVWGVDTSAAALQEARAKLGAAAQLRHADLLTAQLPGDYFDMVVLWHSIEHVPDPGAVLREAARCLRSGGGLLIATPNAQTAQRRWFGRSWSAWRDMGAPPRHLYFFSPRTLTRLVQSVGLRVLAVDQRADALANWIAFKGSLLTWLGWFEQETAHRLSAPARDITRSVTGRARQVLQVLFRSGCWVASRLLAWCGSGDTMVVVGRKP